MHKDVGLLHNYPAIFIKLHVLQNKNNSLGLTSLEILGAKHDIQLSSQFDSKEFRLSLQEVHNKLEVPFKTLFSSIMFCYPQDVFKFTNHAIISKNIEENYVSD